MEDPLQASSHVSEHGRTLVRPCAGIYRLFGEGGPGGRW